MKLAPLAAFCVAALMANAPAIAAPAKPATPQRKIVLIFVADGLRYDSVTPQTAPTMWRLKRQGVDFANSHSVYPTITTVNAASIATGHYPGDTGNFGNQIYTGFPGAVAHGAPVGVMEDDAGLGELNDHFGSNYLNEESLLAAARQAGWATAAIGKIGPTAIQDVTQRDGSGTIVIDDAIGKPGGIPVSAEIAGAMKDAGIAATAPKTSVPNDDQEKYLVDIATRVVLPKLMAKGGNIMMVFWSRDPDASQHSAKDSLGSLSPGINSANGRAGIKDADDTLAALLGALKQQRLDRVADVFVTADHGFSTIDKREDSAQSRAAAFALNTEPGGDQVITRAPVDLPSGFLAIDLADALKLPLFDATGKPVNFTAGATPAFGDGLIGNDARNPDAVVVSNGGTDHIYLPGANAPQLARQIVGILAGHDYVSGIFVSDALGEIPGTLPMSAINLRGTAKTPQPAILVNFASHLIPGCKPALMCAAEFADTSLATGQGMHGTFSRADTRNFMAAAGPDFKARFVDSAPVSNADINPTIAQIAGLTIQPKGGLTGRIAAEGLRGGKRVSAARGRQVSAPGPNRLKTVLDYQQVGTTRYFDAAGFPGRTVGLTVH